MFQLSEETKVPQGPYILALQSLKGRLGKNYEGDRLLPSRNALVRAFHGYRIVLSICSGYLPLIIYLGKL